MEQAAVSARNRLGICSERFDTLVTRSGAPNAIDEINDLSTSSLFSRMCKLRHDSQQSQHRYRWRFERS